MKKEVWAPVSNDSRHTLVNRRVQFKICDVYIPEPRETLWSMYSDSLLQGRVVYQTNNTDGEQFVAVQVEGIEEKLFFPASRVHGFSE